MTQTHDIAAIRNRIGWLERQMLALDGLSWLTDRETLRRRIGVIDTRIRALPDAWITETAAGARLTMLGISVTCTAGTPGVYTNWLTRARALAGTPAEART